MSVSSVMSLIELYKRWFPTPSRDTDGDDNKSSESVCDVCRVCDLLSTPVKRPSNRATLVFRPSISVFSGLISSLTIKRIWLRSASVSSPSAGSAITEKSTENTSIVFMGCSSASLIYPPAMVGGWQKTEKDSVS